MKDIIYNGAHLTLFYMSSFLYHFEADIHINKQTVALQNIGLIS